MASWTLDDIPWQEFDRSKATPHLTALAKAACMVEHNGYDYARYLRAVFYDDEDFKAAADAWAVEEVRHGQALRKWAELADPGFDFEKSFNTFTQGYQLPQAVDASVRGSRSGELLARCIVEVGTSSYYTALKEHTDEPVFKIICAKIAADEFRHYKLFYDYLQPYLAKERLNKLQRARVAISRMMESEDDELAYAYYAAHHAPGEVYDHKASMQQLLALTYPLYRRHHVERMTSMVLKATGLPTQGRLHRAFSGMGWQVIRLRGKYYAPKVRLPCAA